MNIIFDSPHIDVVKQRNLVLELDSFLFAEAVPPIRSYCVVEQIPIMEISTAEHYAKLHADLIEHYQKRNWSVCQDAIQLLRGRWGGELDSFYQNLSERIDQLQHQNLPDSWSGAIDRSQSTQLSDGQQ